MRREGGEDFSLLTHRHFAKVKGAPRVRPPPHRTLLASDPTLNTGHTLMSFRYSPHRSPLRQGPPNKSKCLLALNTRPARRIGSARTVDARIFTSVAQG